MVFCFLFDSIIGNFETSKVELFNIIPKIDIMPQYPTGSNSENKLSVLITGGSGLIGKHLTSKLLDSGNKVSHLSRNTAKPGLGRVFKWIPDKEFIDPEALDGIDYIVHLAGANIGEKRWNEKRKTEIIESRVNSAKFLHKVISGKGIRLKAFISASATGFYGTSASGKFFNENDPPGNDYLANVCQQWEEASDLFNNSGIRTVNIRTAVVLEKSDSALSKLMKPAKYGFLFQTGDGRQYMPWIHIKDLCNIYLKAIIESGMSGSYNATAPQSVTHAEFIKTLGRVMKKPVFPIYVPGFVLKALLGEMSEVVLKGNPVSSEKIMNAGYRFIYSNLETALSNIIND
jgi:uncharacterized protein (TIGR01777 family)